MQQLSKIIESLEKKEKLEKSQENKTDIKEIENIMIDESVSIILIRLSNN
jgi:hypothetical protein